MPLINTKPTSIPEANLSSPFPFSPDSYSLPKSITSPIDPKCPLLPINSPTFLVSSSGIKPTFKVPTSPARPDTRDGINSYVEWVEEKNQYDEDENEGLIMFPTYDDYSFQKSYGRCEDLELLAAEVSDDSYTFSEASASEAETETETDSNGSSRSSSPSLEGEEFDICQDSLCEIWSNASCASPLPTTPPFIFAEDDIALNNSSQVVHCVDYLAHDWKTDDLWASYKHLHSHRECIRASARLENALWRVWWRETESLKRIDPEVIHWFVLHPNTSLEKESNSVARLKETDLTWLYGPFQPSVPPKTSSLQPQASSSPTKSLLKKFDPAQILKQRSEYTFSLLREATGFRIPSPLPSPLPSPALGYQAKFSSQDRNDLGLRTKEKRKGVVFNEIVVLYREVVDDFSDLEDDDREDYFRDFEGEFEGVD